MGVVRDQRPTSSLTNFTLTLMVIFFLQNQYKLLPPFSTLLKLGSLQGQNAPNSGFIRDVSGMQPDLNARYKDESPSQEELLANFFRFYGNFAYQKQISVIDGNVCDKQRDDVLDVANPLEPGLNVASNVQVSGLNHFAKECRIASGVMEKMSTGSLPADIRLLFPISASRGVRIDNLDWDGSTEK